MHLIWTVLIGFLAGLVAKALIPGNGSTGFIMTTVLGIAGSMTANYLGQRLGFYHEGQLAGFIGSVVGAVVLLLIYGIVTRK